MSAIEPRSTVGLDAFAKTKAFASALLALAVTAAGAQPLSPPASPPRYVEGELLVKFVGGPRGVASEQARTRMNHEVKRRFDFIGWEHIRLPKGLSVDQALIRYRRLPGVEAVEPNGVFEAFRAAPTPSPSPSPAEEVFAPTGTLSMPNDPMFTNQWALARIGISNAWTFSTGSSNVVVALLDSGINYNHEDLRANMWRNPGEIPDNGLDDDANGYVDDVYGIDTSSDHDSDPMDAALTNHVPAYYGTVNAGIIGATGNNGLGIVGVNWSVRLMALRVYSPLFVDTIEALEYIHLMKERGVNIRVAKFSYAFGFTYSQAVKDAHDRLAAQGILQVAMAWITAWNFDRNIDVTPVYPATFDTSNLLSVTLSDPLDNLPFEATYGRTNVDLAAPGIGLISTSGETTEAYFTLGAYGENFAASYVAGAAALLFAAYPEASAGDVKTALLESVDLLPAFTNKMVSNGRLNVGRAMSHPRFATGPPRIFTSPQPQTVLLSNSASFVVVSGGARPLRLQWLFNGAELPNATNATLNLRNISFAQAGDYQVVVTNALGSVTSQVATLTLVPFSITGHPQSQNARLTSNATFNVSVTSPLPVNYQWRFNGTNLVGSDSATLVLPNVQLGHDGLYSVEVFNEFGTAVSSNASLVVLMDPAITVAPTSQSVVAGGAATFSVAFTGNPLPFGVEWRQGSVTMASNTVWGFQDFFTLTNAHPTNAATWRVIVRNLAKNIVTGENRTFVVTVAADSDGDGLPDTWEEAYPAAGNPVEDSDHDGLTNLEEYRAGTDPLDNRSQLRIESIALANASNAVSLRFFAVSNKTYTIQQRATTEAGAWKSLMNILASPTDRLVEVTDTNGPSVDSQRLYRLATPRHP